MILGVLGDFEARFVAVGLCEYGGRCRFCYPVGPSKY